MNRREFLVSSFSALGLGLVINRSRIESTKKSPNLDIKNLPEPGEVNEPEIIWPTEVSRPELSSRSPIRQFNEPIYETPRVETPTKKLTPLEEYRDLIKDEKERLREIVKERRLFSGFWNISQQQQIKDFDMYYELYRAGEIKYGTPWFLLWINHVHESGVSTHPAPEGNGLFTGAMQRYPKYYSYSLVREIASDWDFLVDLPQRYLKKEGFKTNDYEEILFAAWKIKKDSDEIRKAGGNKLSFDESLPATMARYCRSDFAAQRVERYRVLKPILQTQSPRFLSSRGSNRPY